MPRRSPHCAHRARSEQMRQIDAAQFPRHTLPAELRDYPRWHRGRPHYAVWMVEVQQPALLAYIQHLQEQLADLLHPPGARQPHLTLFVCGFPQASQRYADDFTPARLDSQLQHLRPRAGSACVLPLGAADSFASAAFIPVYDPQQRLANWRQALAAGSREIRQAEYIAHIPGPVSPAHRRRHPAPAPRRTAHATACAAGRAPGLRPLRQQRSIQPPRAPTEY